MKVLHFIEYKKTVGGPFEHCPQCGQLVDVSKLTNIETCNACSQEWKQLGHYQRFKTVHKRAASVQRIVYPDGSNAVRIMIYRDGKLIDVWDMGYAGMGSRFGHSRDTFGRCLRLARRYVNEGHGEQAVKLHWWN